MVRAPDCHPDRRHVGLGWCSTCYYRETPQGRAAKAKAQANYRRINAARLVSENAVRNLRARGLTVAQFRDMVVGQAGRCLICLRVPQDNLCVDHDHATGRIRGLLCKACNLAIGSLRDDPKSALRAASYLGASPSW